MSEAAKVRDWLSELQSAGEADDLVRFGELVAMLAKAQPDLKSQVCQLAGEYLENGETWAADFFKNSEVQPKRAEPPKHTEPVGGASDFSWVAKERLRREARVEREAAQSAKEQEAAEEAADE